MLFIHQEQDTNATRMAERLGVTKGAISQTLSRLEKKGILRKIKDPYNKNELTIEFTSLGKTILDHYLHVTAELHQQYDQYLSTLTDNERTIIRGFLSQAEIIMDRLMDKVH
jgi:DNA-binding MarR family transcriptional regulator